MMEYLGLVDTTTTGRYDITPLLADGAALAAVVAALYEPFTEERVSHVAGIDALGFALGAGVALQAGAGLLAVRKAGKLPLPAEQLDRMEFIDYTGTSKALELRAAAVPAGARVLVVDDWLETGAQVEAAVRLLEQQGALILGIAALAIEAGSPGCRALRLRYRCHSLWPAVTDT